MTFEPLSSLRVPGHALQRYGLAVVLSMLVTGLRGLGLLLEVPVPLLALLAAPLLASWCGGLGPGLVAAVMSLLFAALVSPSPSLLDLPLLLNSWPEVLTYFVYSIAFSWLIQKRVHALGLAESQRRDLSDAQQALAEREARAQDSLEASPSGMIVVNRQGVIELVNSQAERMFRLSREQLIGQSIEQLVPEKLRTDHAHNREHFHAKPSSRTMGAQRDLWARRGDGSVFPVEIGLNPLKGASTGMVLASVIDISARRRTEEALRVSDQRALESGKQLEADHALLDALLRAVPAGIILVDTQGGLIHSNPAHEQIWGPAPAAFSLEAHPQWKGWWAAGGERQGQRLEADDWALARALRGSNVHDELIEIEPFDRPGQRTTLVVTASPIRDARGDITGAVVAQVDVTELTLAQAAERKSAEMFRALADNISQLAWMTDEQGAMVWYNRRWFDYTGSTQESSRGWGWKAVHHPDHVDRVVSKFSQHIQSGEPWEDTFPLRQHDGQYRWFLSRAFPIRDPSDRIVSWFGTNTDITAQRQAEEALREADRRKDKFISLLAHELRNPLAPVRCAVEILKRTASDDKRLERTSSVIDRQVTHMAHLVDDLLDVSRIGTGKLALQKQVCDLSKIMRETAEDYRVILENSGLKLSIQITPEPMWVNGDPVRLAQMLGNLLINAQRFNNPGDHVQVTLRRGDQDSDCDTHKVSNNEAVLEVKDDGIGIDGELMARLFDPFEQAPQDLARSRGGLGLGLALTKGLAELHGGHIEAHSDGLGQGAAFKLRLPLHTPPIEGQAAKARSKSSAQDLRILIIEDNHDAALTLAELLKLDGHSVETCFDGPSGLIKAYKFRPHIVISDLGLPGELDGYALAKVLRAHAEMRTMYLIALSGYADMEARRRSSEAGYNIHLAKPLDIEMLERVISEVP